MLGEAVEDGYERLASPVHLDNLPAGCSSTLGALMSKPFRNFDVSVWLLLVGFACASFSPQVFAASTENDQVLVMMRTLEARVEALELKNKEYRQEAADARLQARAANERLRLVSAAPSPKLVSATTPSPRNSYALATEPREPSSIWSGAYFGASGGGAVTRSKVAATEQYSSNYPISTYPYNINGQNMTDVSGPGNRGGGLIDVFAGWNFQISRAFVVGGQVEATISDLSFNSAGTRTYDYFNAAGSTGQTAIEDFRPQVSSRWMTSLLLRAGFLVDDQTLLYGIGGWTLAKFEARNLADNSFYQLEESFVAGGWTAGAGIERKLGSSWSVRAEYRYTNFGSHSSGGQFNFQSAGAFAGTQSYQRQAQFDQSMQVGRIGIAYAIGVPR
jgi:opacity protein-like surface antigen